MATAKKKTNYIGYELKWLEKKCKQLQKWVEDKLENGITDRIEVLESTRGNPIIKVIASEETQVKCLRDTLKELPNMLMEINRLRKLAEEEDTGETNVRGNHDIPGFMEDDEEDEQQPVEPVKQKGSSKPKKESPKALPAPNTSAFEDDDDNNDDDGDFEDP